MTGSGRPLRDALEEYLALRRALCFKLAAPARLLSQFTRRVTGSTRLRKLRRVLPAGPIRSISGQRASG
jgi:hypothetical protein